MRNQRLQSLPRQLALCSHERLLNERQESKQSSPCNTISNLSSTSSSNPHQSRLVRSRLMVLESGNPYRVPPFCRVYPLHGWITCMAPPRRASSAVTSRVNRPCGPFTEEGSRMSHRVWSIVSSPKASYKCSLCPKRPIPGSISQSFQDIVLYPGPDPGHFLAPYHHHENWKKKSRPAAAQASHTNRHH